jgi:hypothetical protein
MQNTNYVFLNADEAAIVVTVNNIVVGAAYTAAQLAALFTANDINVSTDTIMCSSSIDFASEEGFDTDDCAHNIIDEAFAALS